MSLELVIACAVLAAAILFAIFMVMPAGSPRIGKGGHGVRMIEAAQEAGKQGAGSIIEQRLGEAYASQFLESFSKGVAPPPPPPAATTPPAPPNP